MRCRECNVDLSETYAKCPLCGAQAANDEPRLKGLKPAPYPHNAPIQQMGEAENPKPGFSFEKIKAYFNF